MNATLDKTGLDIKNLTEDIQRLLKATADVADEGVVEARKRVGAAIGKAGEAWDQGAKYALHYVKQHACETAVFAGLAGTAVGYLVARRFD